MGNDLKIIKKKYGEKMMQFCRDFFPTILETPGLLLALMLNSFYPSRVLYEDIKANHLEEAFKDYIYNKIVKKDNKKIEASKTPKELLSEVGYDLYECTTEKEIQAFKKYYAHGEALCTFKGGRLNSCRVFFAVKKDVSKIKREEFKVPNRQDMYGTSVISIQFTKNQLNTLSIKNRYNHKVENPDATFSNNLDNIVAGLTDSFEKEYGIKQLNKECYFEIPSYVMDNNGVHYKFNYEIGNIYYCPDNIIIDNFEVKKFDKSSFIVLDYFILDLQNKTISLYDTRILESFCKTIEEIRKIDVVCKNDYRIIVITPKIGSEILIVLDKTNKIIGYKNNNITQIATYFLFNNHCLEWLEATKLREIESFCLYNTPKLQTVNLPALKAIGIGCFSNNEEIKKQVEVIVENNQVTKKR